jgi:hypothetical protein
LKNIRKTMPRLRCLIDLQILNWDLRCLDLSSNTIVRVLNNVELVEDQPYEEPVGGGVEFRREVLILLNRLEVGRAHS